MMLAIFAKQVIRKIITTPARIADMALGWVFE
jgi:hypothetical protein